MSQQPTAYPFDPYGNADTNIVTGERHTLTPAAPNEFHFIVPRWAPFFRKDFKIRHVETGEELKEGQHFHFAHRFDAASQQAQQPIYGSIVFISNELANNVDIEFYRTLGGDWTLSETEIVQWLSDKVTNPRTTRWDNVVDLPSAFPPVDHMFDATDLTGMLQIYEGLGRIEDAIYQSADKSNQPTPDGFLSSMARQYSFEPVYSPVASWTRLCKILVAYQPTSDLTLMVTGAEAVNKTDNSTFLLNVGIETVYGSSPSPDDPPPVDSVDTRLVVTQLSTDDTNVKFGYRYVAGNVTGEEAVEIWVKNPLQRGTLTVTSLTNDDAAVFADGVVEIEPLDVTWVDAFEVGRSPATDSERLGGYVADEYVRKDLMISVMGSIQETLDHLAQDPNNPPQTYPPEFFVTRAEWFVALNDFIADVDAMTDYLNGEPVNLPDEISQVPQGPQTTPTGRPDYFIYRTEVTLTINDLKETLETLLHRMEQDGEISDADALLDRIQPGSVITIPFPGGSKEQSTNEAAISFLSKTEFSVLMGEVIFVLNQAITALST